MSDDDDDTPPEALFFTKRAEFVPKVSAEEFKSVFKLLDEEEKIKLPDPKLKKPASKKGKKIHDLKSYIPADKEIILDDYSNFSSPSPTPDPVTLTSSAKRRLRRLETEREREMKLIEAENKKVLAAADYCTYDENEDVLSDEDENYANFILTVTYMSETSRLRCCEDEKFSTIFPKVAEQFKLKPSEMLLCFNHQNIKVEDTPRSLNMTLSDSIECIPYKGSEKITEVGTDKMKIFFQSEGNREKIELLVHKLEKMHEIKKRYAEKCEIMPENVHFEFDGDKIEGTETPLDLDMEVGNCIDVKILGKKASPVKRKKGQRKKRYSPRKKKNTPLTVVCIGDSSRDSIQSNDSDILVM